MITLYSKSSCLHCTASKRYLTQNQIAFTEVDVMADSAALDFLRAQGHRSVPQLYVGNRLLLEGGNTALQGLPPDAVRSLIAERVAEVFSDLQTPQPVVPEPIAEPTAG